MRRGAEREVAINGFFEVPMAITFRRWSFDGLHDGNRGRWPAFKPAGKGRHGRCEKRRHDRECCRGSKPHGSTQCNARSLKSFHGAQLKHELLAPQSVLHQNDDSVHSPDHRSVFASRLSRHAAALRMRRLADIARGPDGVLRARN